MARGNKPEVTPAKVSSRTARKTLAVCKANAPHWVSVTKGTAVGYYKGVRERSWYVRQRAGDKYLKERLGAVDDFVDADGHVVLSYAQAVALATTRQIDKREARPKHYADGLTLTAVVDAYIDEQLAGKGSQKNSRQQWNRHGHDSIGAKLVTALDAPDMRRWHKAMATKPPTIRGKVQDFDPADPEQARRRKATANRVLTIPSAALNWAWRGDGSVTLPATMPTWWAKVKPFALGDDPPPRMLEQGEIRRLLNAAPPDLCDLLSGALMTGARRGELLTLQVRDYDSDNAVVRIQQHKTGKPLTQPLTSEGVALFDRLTAGRAPTDPVFARSDGRAWGKHDVQKPMKAAVAAAKLDDVSFKTTRATYGKLLLVATKDIEIVARALGHSDSRITRKHYAAYLPNEVTRAVAKLPKLGLMNDTNITRMRAKKSGTRR